MVNVNKLKGKIVENGLNVETLSRRVKIDKSTFYRRLAQNGKEFTIAEADAIVNELNLSSEDAFSIFFSQFVARNATM
jgi:hypothetical protein